MNKKIRLIRWRLLKARLYLEHLKPTAFYLPAIVFLLSTCALMLLGNLFKLTDYWENWNQATGNAFHFCEMNRMDEFIRQPSNTWSNLGYFVVGLFTITLGVNDLKKIDRKESDNFLVRHPLFSIMFGVSALYLFIGSFLFHASLTRYFQKIDQTGLYSVVVMLLVFNLYKIFPLVRFKGQWKSSHTLMMVFAVLFNYIIFARLWTININILFPVLITIVFITSLYYIIFVNREHYFGNYMWVALTTLLLAGIIWILDRTDVTCNPVSVFQGHALWHLLTATSIFFIYMYYRSGTVPIQEVIALRNERRAMRKL